MLVQVSGQGLGGSGWGEQNAADINQTKSHLPLLVRHIFHERTRASILRVRIQSGKYTAIRAAAQITFNTHLAQVWLHVMYVMIGDHVYWTTGWVPYNLGDSSYPQTKRWLWTAGPHNICASAYSRVISFQSLFSPLLRSLGVPCFETVRKDYAHFETAYPKLHITRCFFATRAKQAEGTCPKAYVLRFTTVPSIAIHASSQWHSVLRSAALCTPRSSPTATPVSHGCKYQHGICSVGCSPCESSGNTAGCSSFSGSAETRGSMCVSCTDAPASTSGLKRLVWTRRPRLSGEPSAK